MKMTIDLERTNSWRNAAELLPPKDTLVEVCGHSGMAGNIYFLAYAQHMPDYQPHEPWRGVMFEALRDYGWTPLFWRFPQPLPEMPEYDGENDD